MAGEAATDQLADKSDKGNVWDDTRWTPAHFGGGAIAAAAGAESLIHTTPESVAETELEEENPAIFRAWD